MKINFVLPFVDKTGGTYVVLEHASRLSKMNHDVCVYYPLLPYSIYSQSALRRSKWFFQNLFRAKNKAQWFRNHVEIQPVVVISDNSIRNADVVIATAWPTAYTVANLARSKGMKFYFVQDYEIWNGNVQAVDNSFLLPLKIIVISPWLKKLIQEKFGRQIASEVHNGIDLELFKPPDKRSPEPLTILMMYHQQPYKGSKVGLDVLKKMHDSYPDVRIKMFGNCMFDERNSFVEYFRSPTSNELLELYQTSHIFLSPSLQEGWGLPIMEAMACGCAVVATRTGCVPVLERNENLLSVEPNDPDALFLQIETLIRDRTKLEEVSRLGYETILSYDWGQFSKQFESILMENIDKVTMKDLK